MTERYKSWDFGTIAGGRNVFGYDSAYFSRYPRRRNNRNTRRYAIYEGYCLHLYDAKKLELLVVQKVEVVRYTPQGELFVSIVDHRQDNSVSDEDS
jgi:hypothetical protein